jgi:hypothetical protein
LLDHEKFVKHHFLWWLYLDVLDTGADDKEGVVSRWIRRIFGKDDNGFENDRDDLDVREVDDDDFDSIDDILSLVHLKQKAELISSWWLKMHTYLNQ